MQANAVTASNIYAIGTVFDQSLTLWSSGAAVSTYQDTYKAENAHAFTKHANGEFSLTFTTLSTITGNEKITFSRAVSTTGNYSTWSSNGFYTPAGTYGRTLPVNGYFNAFNYTDEAERTLVNLEPSTEYTIYINSDITAMWILPGAYKENSLDNALYLIPVTTNSSGTELGVPVFNGLTDPAYTSAKIRHTVVLPYDSSTRTYSYHVIQNAGSTGASGPRFGIFTHPTNRTLAYRVTATNYISSDQFDADNTKYLLSTNAGGDQQIKTGSSDITLWLDRDSSGNLRHLWVTDNEKEAPLYITSATNPNYSAPDKFTYNNVTGKYTYTNIRDGGDGEVSFMLSNYKSAAADNSSAGFVTGQIGYWPANPTINLNQTVNMYNGYQETLTLGKHFGATLTVASNPRRITLSGSDEPTLYIKGSLNGISDALAYDTSNSNRPIIDTNQPGAKMNNLGNGLYSYHATSNLSGNFAIYLNSACTYQEHYSCVNYKSDEPLTADGVRYYISSSDPYAGYQILDAATGGSLANATGVTIYVDINKNLLWIEEDNAAPNFFISEYSISTKRVESYYYPQRFTLTNETDQFGNLYYIYKLPASSSTTYVSFANAATASKDRPASVSLLHVDTGTVFFNNKYLFDNASTDLNAVGRTVYSDAEGIYEFELDNRQANTQTLRLKYNPSTGSVSVTLNEINYSEISHNGETIVVPDVYIQGKVLAHSAPYTYSRSGSNIPINFAYDPNYEVYYCNITNSDYSWQSNYGTEMMLSTATGNQSLWIDGGLKSLPAGTDIATNQRYPLVSTAGASTVGTSNLASFGSKTSYTVFINKDRTVMWLMPGGGYATDGDKSPYRQVYQQVDYVTPLYVRGAAVGTQGYTKSGVRSMSYVDDGEQQYYKYIITPGTNTDGTFDLSFYATNMLSTAQSDWALGNLRLASTTPIAAPGRHLAPGDNSIASDGLHYPLVVDTSGAGSDLTIRNFDQRKTYAICVSADFSELWIETETSLYLMGNVINVDNAADAQLFNFDVASGVFYYEFEYLGYGHSQFSMSTSVDSWAAGAYAIDDASRTLALATKYTIHKYSTGYNMTIDSTDGVNLHDGVIYTIYVSPNLNKMKVYEGPFNEALCYTRDLYVGDNIVNISGTSNYTMDKVGRWLMTYDPVNHWYHLRVPAGTTSLTTGDFQISTTPGDYATWKSGIFYAPNYNISVEGATKHPMTPDGTKYDLMESEPDNTTGHWQTIGYYNNAYTYNIYVGGDLKKVWITVEPDAKQLYLLGWFTQNPTGAYGNNAYKEVGNILSGKRAMNYDSDKKEWNYTMAGLRGSVFEISTDGSSNSYDTWARNMLRVDVPGGATITPELYPNMIVPGEEVDVTTLRRYDVRKVRKISGRNSGTYTDYDIQDHGIQGLDHDNLYTIHVSYNPVTDNYDKVWVTMQPVHMPLKFDDFIKPIEGNDAGAFHKVPHYFIVGTRTADWRLLPEWELKPGSDGNLHLSGRFMYDGYFAIARVDNYLDYVNHRYEIFANPFGDTDHQNFTDPSQTIPLESHDMSGALHYTIDDPVHDTGNSITWNCDPADESAGAGLTTDKMMNESLPFYITDVTVTLTDPETYYIPGNALNDENISTMGNPDTVKFTGTYAAADILPHRTFSFVGSHVNYESLFQFSKLGPKYLFQMTPAYKDGDPQRTFWANSWISWDESGKPYYDAYGNTLFLTAYDKEWISSHDIFFDMLVGENMLEYNSDNMVFTAASDLDTTDDEYAWLYSKHVGTADSPDMIGSDEKREEPIITIIQNKDTDPDFKFTERLVEHYDKAFDYNDGVEGVTADDKYGYHKHTWKCYVVKDIWLNGDFKVWTGWGGHLKATEGWNTPADQAEDIRWYYGNFGHNVPNRVFPVEGHDVLTTTTTSDPNNYKDLYLTYRDVDGAYFTVDPRGTNTPQYFNRVLLWYDTSSNRNDGNQPNGVLQFIRGTIIPNAQAFRQAGHPKMLSVNFDLSDSSVTTSFDENDNEVIKGAYDDYHVLSYRIIRYRMNGQTEEVYRDFGTTATSTKTKVAHWTHDDIGYTFNDPYELPGGTYFYRVIFTIGEPDDPDITHTLTAASNKITISEESKPVTIDAYQVRYRKSGDAEVESITGNLYSFDVKVVTDYADDDVALGSMSHHDFSIGSDYSVYEDMDRIVITVDAATAAALNAAPSSSIVNSDRCAISTANVDAPNMIYCTDNDTWYSIRGYINHFFPVRFYRITGNYDNAYLGWVIDSNNIVDGKIVFDSNNQIVFHYSKYYDRLKIAGSTAEIQNNRMYFQSLDDLRANIKMPVIVWNTVCPNENVAGADDSLYTFEIKLEPSSSISVTDVVYNPEIGDYEVVNKPLSEVWNTVLRFKDDTSSTGVYAPATTIRLVPTFTRYAGTVDYSDVDYTDASHIENMPVGSVASTSTGVNAAAPAHYTAVNEIQSTVTTSIPLAQRTIDTTEIGYGIAFPEYDDESFSYNTTVALRDDTNLNGVLHNMHFVDESSPNDRFSRGSGNLNNDHSRHYTLGASRVYYSPTVSVTYATDNWAVTTDGAYVRNAGSLSLASLANPKFTMSQHNNNNDDLAMAGYLDPNDSKWYYRVVVGLQADPSTYNFEDYAAYFGFDTNGVSSNNIGNDLDKFGRRAQGGEPVYNIAMANSYYENDKVAMVWGNIYEIDDDNLAYMPLVDMMQSYYPYDASNGYDDNANNWAAIAARYNYLAICVEPVSVSTSKFTGEGSFDVEMFVTYPIVSGSEGYIEEGNIKNAIHGLAPARAPKSAVEVNHTKIVPLTAMASPVKVSYSEDIVTGIETVEASMLDGEAEYYNLQGIRVVNPAPGQIYIVRRGLDVRKVLVK